MAIALWIAALLVRPPKRRDTYSADRDETALLRRSHRHLCPQNGSSTTWIGRPSIWAFECSCWIDMGVKVPVVVAVASAAALPPDFTQTTVPPAPAHIAQPRMMALSMGTSVGRLSLLTSRSRN